MSKSLLVVAAQVGDFVWRCGGAIALHAEKGVPVHIVCLSLREHGEANGAWAAGRVDRREVNAIRQRAADAAAALLGAASMAFFDLGDYPLIVTPHVIERLSKLMRELQPAVVITHPEKDPSNLDHCKTFETVLAARMQAIAPGHGKNYI